MDRSQDTKLGTHLASHITVCTSHGWMCRSQVTWLCAQVIHLFELNRIVNAQLIWFHVFVKTQVICNINHRYYVKTVGCIQHVLRLQVKWNMYMCLQQSICCDLIYQNELCSRWYEQISWLVPKYNRLIAFFILLCLSDTKQSHSLLP